MATQNDVRRIACKLPGVEQAEERFAFSVRNKGKAKGFAWVWMERVDPKKPRVPQPKVVAMRVANLATRETMIAADPRKFFTEPHYSGFPAVLVRLDEVTTKDLEVLVADAWRCQAPKELLEPTSTPKKKAKATKKTAKARKSRPE
ncbi:MAG: MmcQ/YjbR family DNA-binding protein [Gemmatimonadaceae bacterium]